MNRTIALRLAALQKERKAAAKTKAAAMRALDFSRAINYDQQTGRIFYDDGREIRPDDPRLERWDRYGPDGRRPRIAGRWIG